MRSSQRSSRSSASLVEARLTPSRLIVGTAIGAHAVAALPAFFLPIPSYSVVVWLAAVAGSLGWCLGRRPVRAIRRLSDGRWLLTLPDGEIEAELADWYVHPWLCVASFRARDRFRRTVVVPCWTLDAEVHRRLRVALRAAERA